MAASHVVITLEFQTGSYGWSEPYYLDRPEGASLGSFDNKAVELCRERIKLCGAGVQLIGYRTSDVNIRRDAAVNTVNYLAVLAGEIALGPAPAPAAPGGGGKFPAAFNSPCIIPNVACIVRIEGADKVYHAPHFFSGLPQAIVGQDQVILRKPEWDLRVDIFGEFLESNNFLFPCKNRAAPFDDRKILFIDSVDPTKVTLDNAAGLLPNMVVRLINCRYAPNSSLKTKSFVSRVANVAGNVVTLRTAATGLIEGPKSVLHAEETTYVAIFSVQTQYNSHRNRGRPFNSPRGRRKRVPT